MVFRSHRLMMHLHALAVPAVLAPTCTLGAGAGALAQDPGAGKRKSGAKRLLRWNMAVGFVRTLVIVAVMLAIAGPAAAHGKRLTTEKEFRELVVDRELTGERITLRYAGDGRMSGVSRGERVEGTWDWGDAVLCRTATLGSRSLGYDCLAIFVIGDLVIIVRDEGRGRAFALRFRNEDIQPDDSEEFALSCYLC